MLVRAPLRVALGAATLLAALAAPAPAWADFERCCFRVEAEASGRLAEGAEQVTWRWTLRQVGRYVQHGRIFNAITGIEGVGNASVLRGAFEAHGPGCHERRVTDGSEPSGAYASLEDGATSGRITLVVRAGNAGRGILRCIPNLDVPTRLGGPWEYEIDPPPGVSLRHSRSFAVTSTSSVEGGGRSAIRVRFTYVAPDGLEQAVARLSGEAARIPPGLARAE